MSHVPLPPPTPPSTPHGGEDDGTRVWWETLKGPLGVPVPGTRSPPETSRVPENLISQWSKDSGRGGGLEPEPEDLSKSRRTRAGVGGLG